MLQYSSNREAGINLRKEFQFLLNNWVEEMAFQFKLFILSFKVTIILIHCKASIECLCMSKFMSKTLLILHKCRYLWRIKRVLDINLDLRKHSILSYNLFITQQSVIKSQMQSHKRWYLPADIQWLQNII